MVVCENIRTFAIDKRKVLLQKQLNIKVMVTIKFINTNGKGQITVKDSQKEDVINSLLAVGYGILKIEQ